MPGDADDEGGLAGPVRGGQPRLLPFRNDGRSALPRLRRGFAASAVRDRFPLRDNGEQPSGTDGTGTATIPGCLRQPAPRTCEPRFEPGESLLGCGTHRRAGAAVGLPTGTAKPEGPFPGTPSRLALLVRRPLP